MAHSIFGWSYPPGCSGPPDECWSQELSAEMYHASTEYKCANCGQPIKKGELYRYATYITEDGFHSTRSHIGDCLYYDYQQEQQQ